MAALREIRIPVEIVIPVVVREQRNDKPHPVGVEMVVEADLANVRIELNVPIPDTLPIVSP